MHWSLYLTASSASECPYPGACVIPEGRTQGANTTPAQDVRIGVFAAGRETAHYQVGAILVMCCFSSCCKDANSDVLGRRGVGTLGTPCRDHTGSRIRTFRCTACGQIQASVHICSKLPSSLALVSPVQNVVKQAAAIDPPPVI